jgi:hypothetical protein
LQEADLSWCITKWDGEHEIAQWVIPGRFGEAQICTLLERLLAKTLSEQEIVQASLGESTLLSRVGTGLPISYGTNPHFTAERIDAEFYGRMRADRS